MRLIIMRQLTSISTNITIKKQTIKIENYNIITNNLKKAKNLLTTTITIVRINLIFFLKLVHYTYYVKHNFLFLNKKC